MMTEKPFLKMNQKLHQHNLRTQGQERLFVAGFPSGISIKAVLKFFKTISPSFYVSAEDSYDEYTQRMAQKGCFEVNCSDSAVSADLVKRKYIEFKGRTLTVMPFKSGTDLIIQNKKMKKRRVILKRVPWYVDEEALKRQLEMSCGRLQLFFQLMHDQSLGRGGRDQPTKLQKHKSYSVYFELLEVAKDLVTQGFFQLEDGTFIEVHKYPEPKTNSDVSPSGNLQKGVKQKEALYGDSRREKTSKRNCHKGVSEVVETSGPFKHHPGGELKKAEYFDAHQTHAHHIVKPTEKAYFLVSELGFTRELYFFGRKANRYRLNRPSS